MSTETGNSGPSDPNEPTEPDAASLPADPLAVSKTIHSATSPTPSKAVLTTFFATMAAVPITFILALFEQEFRSIVSNTAETEKDFWLIFIVTASLIRHLCRVFYIDSLYQGPSTKGTDKHWQITLFFVGIIGSSFFSFFNISQPIGVLIMAIYSGLSLAMFVFFLFGQGESFSARNNVAAILVDLFSIYIWGTIFVTWDGFSAENPQSAKFMACILVGMLALEIYKSFGPSIRSQYNQLMA